MVSSARSGMGKSLFIKRMAAKLKNENKGSDHVTIPLHGPVVTPVSVLNYLIKHIKKPLCTLYHIDVSQSVSCVSLIQSLVRIDCLVTIEWLADIIIILF